jgi:hypothetical protein
MSAAHANTSSTAQETDQELSALTHYASEYAPPPVVADAAHVRDWQAEYERFIRNPGGFRTSTEFPINGLSAGAPTSRSTLWIATPNRPNATRSHSFGLAKTARSA